MGMGSQCFFKGEHQITSNTIEQGFTPLPILTERETHCDIDPIHY